MLSYLGKLYKNQCVYPSLTHQRIVIFKPPRPWWYTTIKLYCPPEHIIYYTILICCYMAQLKHIPNNSILGRHFHDKVTPFNPPKCQNRVINHCTFTTVTVLILNNENQGCKFDKLSERFGVWVNQWIFYHIEIFRVNNMI